RIEQFDSAEGRMMGRFLSPAAGRLLRHRCRLRLSVIVFENCDPVLVILVDAFTLDIVTEFHVSIEYSSEDPFSFDLRFCLPLITTSRQRLPNDATTQQRLCHGEAALRVRLSRVICPPAVTKLIVLLIESVDAGTQLHCKLPACLQCP